MALKQFSFFLLLVIFLPADSAVAAQPSKVRISYSSSHSITPFVLAAQWRFFTEEGIDVELIQVNPRLSATAVLNGDRPPSAAFCAAFSLGGFPLKFVAVSVCKSEHFF